MLDTGEELRFWNLANVKSYGFPELKIKKQSGIPNWPPPGRPPIPGYPRAQQGLDLEETGQQSSIENLFAVPEFKRNTWNGQPFDSNQFLQLDSNSPLIHKGSTPIEIIKLYGVPDVFDLQWSSNSRYDELSYKETIEDQDSFSHYPPPFHFLIQYRINADRGKSPYDNCVTFLFRFSFVNQEVPRDYFEFWHPLNE